MSKHLSDKLDHLKTLETGKGIQYILDSAYKILGNPILTHDMEYKLIAHSECDIIDDPIWNEFVTTGTVGADRLKFYKAEGFLDAVANAEKIVTLVSDKLKYDRIFGKLFNRDHIQVGCASIVAYDKPFEEDDLILFEAACGVISEELGRGEFFQNYGQAYLETLIGKLIEGSIEDKGVYMANVESLYMHCKDNLYLVAADIGEYDLEAFIRDYFKRILFAHIYAVYARYIVMIVSTDDMLLNVDKEMSGFHEFLDENNLYAGISSCFDNLFELRKYYLEAVSALEYGQSGGSGQRIFRFEEMR